MSCSFILSYSRSVDNNNPIATRVNSKIWQSSEKWNVNQWAWGFIECFTVILITKIYIHADSFFNSHQCTMVQNCQKYRLKYQATCSSVSLHHSLVRLLRTACFARFARFDRVSRCPESLWNGSSVTIWEKSMDTFTDTGKFWFWWK